MINIGVHLRDNQNLLLMLENAKKLNINCFQFFLTRLKESKFINITDHESERFIQEKTSFHAIFAHSSYWINLASGKKTTIKASKVLLRQEIEYAQRLKIPYLVLHPGSATGYDRSLDNQMIKRLGINQLTKSLDEVLKPEDSITLLLENTAHANYSIGSDLHDFTLIKKQLPYPDKIAFCFDTAHAHAYGYNLNNLDALLQTLDITIGLDSIKLLHLNDSSKRYASKQDCHQIPGMGQIGTHALKNIATSHYFTHIPKIFEPPLISFNKVIKVLKTISKW